MVQNPGKIGLNGSLTQDQAEIAWNKAVEYATGPNFSHWVRDIVRSPYPRLIFHNGSELWARNYAHDGEHIRGHTFGWANTDEAAYCKQKALEVVDGRLVDTDGAHTKTSTPKGKGGAGSYYWQLFKSALEAARGGDRRYFVQSGSSYENPHISHAAIDDYARTKPREFVDQEIYAKFIEGSGMAFRSDDIDAAVDWDVEVLDSAEWGEPYREGVHVDGWDLARKSDHTVGVTLRHEYPRMRCVAFSRFNRVPWPAQERRIEDRKARYRSTKTVVDATGLGDVVVDHLDVRGIEPFVFTKPRKDGLIATLAYALEHRLLALPPIPQLLDELRSYERDDADLETDCVMALAMAVQGAMGGLIDSVPVTVLGREPAKLPSREEASSMVAGMVRGEEPANPVRDALAARWAALMEDDD